MPEEWTLSIVVPIFKEKCNIRNYGYYGAVKLLHHGMKVVGNGFIRLHGIVTVNEMQFDNMPERGRLDTVFILRRLQEAYHVKEKSCMYFVDLEKAIERLPRKVFELAMRKDGMPEDLVRSVVSLYEEAKTRVGVDSDLSEEFEINVGMHQGSVLSYYFFAVVVNVVTELARGCVEFLYVDD